MSHPYKFGRHTYEVIDTQNWKRDTLDLFLRQRGRNHHADDTENFAKLGHALRTGDHKKLAVPEGTSHCQIIPSSGEMVVSTRSQTRDRRFVAHQRRPDDHERQALKRARTVSPPTGLLHGTVSRGLTPGGVRKNTVELPIQGGSESLTFVRFSTPLMMDGGRDPLEGIDTLRYHEQALRDFARTLPISEIEAAGRIVLLCELGQTLKDQPELAQVNIGESGQNQIEPVQPVARPAPPEDPINTIVTLKKEFRYGPYLPRTTIDTLDYKAGFLHRFANALPRSEQAAIDEIRRLVRLKQHKPSEGKKQSWVDKFLQYE